ncbi:MAG: T9SS type A sorting domain-containing protein [Bacteroidia bacterium]
MFRKLLLLFSLLVFHIPNQAQVILPTVVDTLPPTLFESSSLSYAGNYTFWTNNDSGDSARIFLIDTSVAIIRTYRLMNTPASDWEALTQDTLGNIYVGDFGNNANNRTNLRIYKIPADSLQQDSMYNPPTLHFAYADQDSFPADSSFFNFDCEAMIHRDVSLHLFSKSRSSFWCRRYVLPDTAGVYLPAPRDSFLFTGWITDAALSPSRNVLALLNETNLWIFSAFPNDSFFAGQFTHFAFPAWTQKEGLTFVNDSSFYMTDEKVFSFGRKLYRFQIPNYSNPLSTNTTLASQNPAQLFLHPNTNPTAIVIGTILLFTDKAKWSVFDVQGRSIDSGELYAGENISINAVNLKSGIYTIQLIAGDQACSLLLLWP